MAAYLPEQVESTVIAQVPPVDTTPFSFVVERLITVVVGVVGPTQAQRALENQEQRKLQKKLDDIRMQIATLQDALRAETEAAAKQKAGNSFAANLQKNVKVRNACLLYHYTPVPC